MKREYVVPDLLASITADALFPVTPRRAERDVLGPPQPTTIERLSRWLKRPPDASSNATPGVTARDTLTDDWAGGWYARTRLLQATTLAHHAANSGAATGQNAGLDASAVDAKASS